MVGLLWLLFFGLYIMGIRRLTQESYSIFRKNRWIEFNFRGEPVIQSFGLNIIVHYILYVTFLYAFQNLFVQQTYLLLIEAILLVLFLLTLSMVGWIDDHYGTHEVKGVVGHLKAFILEHTLTSGMLKALFGSLIACLISFFYSVDLASWLLNTAVLLFSIHFFNLLDVRPGRTIKSFWLLSFVLLPMTTMAEMTTFVWPMFFSTLVMFHYDRHRLAMLGDTGSNVLGGLFGYYLLIVASVEVRFLFMISFLVLSLFAEKYSFTETIKKTPWLSKLDNWGIR